MCIGVFSHVVCFDCRCCLGFCRGRGNWSGRGGYDGGRLGGEVLFQNGEELGDCRWCLSNLGGFSRKVRAGKKTLNPGNFPQKLKRVAIPRGFTAVV